VTLQVLGRLLIPRGFELAPMEAGPNSAVAVLARPTRPRTTVPPASVFESFQLAPFIIPRAQSADERIQAVDYIVNAIRTAWEMDPSHDKDALRIKFHSPTSILLVSGPGPAIDTAKNVLGSLRRTADDSSPPKTPNAKP
jgi:hypothetical protein